MTRVNITALAERSRWFSALASPIRLSILELLRESDLCVCDIELELGLSRLQAHRHLNVLSTAQLVTSSHDGTWQYYSIVAENLRQLSEYLEFLGEPLLLPAPDCGSPDFCCGESQPGQSQAGSPPTAVSENAAYPINAAWR